MEEGSQTNWCQSVTGVVLREGKVLLARHTYGSGRGKFIVPGGYVQYGETPQDAVKREFYEETRVRVEPRQILAIRFNPHDWYIAFGVEYISGEAVSDHDENDAVVWMDWEEALEREDVPNLTKQLIRCAVYGKGGLLPIPYAANPQRGWGYLYGVSSGEDEAACRCEGWERDAG